MGNQLETFRQGENIRTGNLEVPRKDISFFASYSEGEKTKTEINCEEDKSIKIYQFGEYKVEVKLDPEGRLLYIKGYITPERKKYCKELFRLDEEFPESPLE